jgi:hypothetical protein
MFRESDAKGLCDQAVQRERLDFPHSRGLCGSRNQGVIRLKSLPPSDCSGTAYFDIPLVELVEFLAISDKGVVN